MYHLLSILPIDIVYYIYIINKKSTSINVVSKYYVYCKNKKKSLNSTTYKRLNSENLKFIEFEKVNISSSQLRKIWYGLIN